jgi:16S rRNA (guanine(966)-N(2))-methyltransferase RsmD
LRVIAGKLKGRKIHISSSSDLRATADRVKESIFNILKGEIEDRQVLDLFSGTGNLGIESISRGAKSVILVDYSKQSVNTIKRNLESLDCIDNAEILGMDYKKAISRLARQGKKFDLVFADPPYLKGYVQEIIDCLVKEKILNDNALIVMEHHKKESINADSIGLIQLKQRKFGDTLVTILFKKE